MGWELRGGLRGPRGSEGGGVYIKWKWGPLGSRAEREKRLGQGEKSRRLLRRDFLLFLSPPLKCGIELLRMAEDVSGGRRGKKGAEAAAQMKFRCSLVFASRKQRRKEGEAGGEREAKYVERKGPPRTPPFRTF